MKMLHKGENIESFLWPQSSYKAKREVFSYCSMIVRLNILYGCESWDFKKQWDRKKWEQQKWVC